MIVFHKNTQKIESPSTYMPKKLSIFMKKINLT